MAIVLLTGDLNVISRVEGAAMQLGESVQTFSSAADAVSNCRAQSAKILVVDLAAPAVDVYALMDSLQQSIDPRPRVVAFGPHVHTERLEAAREAGCEVASRGEFFARIGAILASG